MQVVWSRHSRERFFERALKYGITTDESEQQIVLQKVKEKQANGTVKTIFKLLDCHFTVIKEESQKLIYVVSIWESNEKEVELWLKKK